MLLQDTKSAAAVAAVPFFKVKLGELEKIKSVAAEYPHLKWTPVVTGPFFDFVTTLNDIDDEKLPVLNQILVSQARLLRL